MVSLPQTPPSEKGLKDGRPVLASIRDSEQMSPAWEGGAPDLVCGGAGAVISNEACPPDTDAGKWEPRGMQTDLGQAPDNRPRVTRHPHRGFVSNSR
jgi:hypothetical protein